MPSETPSGPASAGSDSADDGLVFAVACARIAAENRTDEVEVLDLRGLTGISDFFVIGTGTSERQMHAVVDFIDEHAERIGRDRFKMADSREAAWILADYVDVMVHLFDPEHRAFYDLDGLWGDAPRIDWRDESIATPNVRPVQSDQYKF